MTIEFRYLTDEALIAALIAVEDQVHASERGRATKTEGTWGDAVRQAMVIAGEVWRRNLMARYLATLGQR